MSPSPTVAGTPPGKFPKAPDSLSRTPSSKSSSSKYSLDFSPDKPEGNQMRRRRIYDYGDVLGEETDEPFYKGKQKNALSDMEVCVFAK